MKNQQRKYAYEKAIEAYWKHVDRYHTWMNYYSIFNGALFIGYYSLWTTENNKIQTTLCWLILLMLVALMGIIASCSWLKSLKGHEKWESNWINIVKLYETIGVYNLIVAEKTDVEFSNTTTNKKPVFGENDSFKAYSTHKITEEFVKWVIVGWIVCFIMPLFYIATIEVKGLTTWEIIAIILIAVFVLLKVIVPIVFYIVEQACRLRTKKGDYSNVKDMYWIDKSIIDKEFLPSKKRKTIKQNIVIP